MATTSSKVDVALPEETKVVSEETIKDIIREEFKGGSHALRKLKSQCDGLQEQNKKYLKSIELLKRSIEDITADRQTIQEELVDKINIIATLRQKETAEERISKMNLETEVILKEEIKKRKKVDSDNKILSDRLNKANSEIETLQIKVRELEAIRDLQQNIINEMKSKMDEYESSSKNFEFIRDSLRVEIVKKDNDNENLMKQMKIIAERNDYLTQMESTFNLENSQLQAKLRELLEANALVTTNYQAIKKNHDLKRVEFEQLTTELEDAKIACQLAIRQRKTTQMELSAANKHRSELVDKVKLLENMLLKKEKDISELLSKVNDTINDYELKLERKEEQMWAMTLQLSEESQKQRTHNTSNIDPDFISDMEKKWKAKEQVLQEELDILEKKMTAKDDLVKNLNNRIADLTMKQFQPRMERLKEIEADIKSKIEEYCLADEKMETRFLCPRDLVYLKKPVTLMPCGHTYCEECVEAIKLENYNELHCQFCNVKVDNMFRNEQVESLVEQFASRKLLTSGFIKWVKTFNAGEMPT